jgi:dTDP-4-amino-4,6-dideoxygalactose transaminase
MQKLDHFIGRRRRLVELYKQHIGHLSGIRLVTESAGRRSSYHLMIALIAGGPERRRQVYDRLHAAGIRVQVHYIPIHLQPWYRERFGFKPGDFPKAEAYSDACLSLPMFPTMSDADVAWVVEALRVALGQ